MKKYLIAALLCTGLAFGTVNAQNTPQAPKAKQENTKGHHHKGDHKGEHGQKGAMKHEGGTDKKAPAKADPKPAPKK